MLSFDVSLGPIHIKLDARVDDDSLSEEVNGKVVVIDKSLFGFGFEIGSHRKATLGRRSGKKPRGTRHHNSNGTPPHWIKKKAHSCALAVLSRN